MNYILLSGDFTWKEFEWHCDAVNYADEIEWEKQVEIFSFEGGNNVNKYGVAHGVFKSDKFTEIVSMSKLKNKLKEADCKVHSFFGWSLGKPHNDPGKDMVNHPPHYNQGDIECIDAMRSCSTEEEFKGYLKLCAMKYLWRFNYKSNPTEDLDKAIWYLSRLREQST